MAGLYYLPKIVREMNEEERLRLESLRNTEQPKIDAVNVYRKPFIPYNQTLNTHAIHAGAA